MIFNISVAQVKNLDQELNSYSNRVDSLYHKVNNNSLVKKYAKYDTLYIVFKDTKKLKRTQVIQYSTFKDTSIVYPFAITKTLSANFSYKKYKDFDSRESKIKSTVFKLNKSFLANDNYNIIRNDFFDSCGSLDVAFLKHVLRAIFQSKKNLFIIDEDEFINDEIVLRQIVFDDFTN